MAGADTTVTELPHHQEAAADMGARKVEEDMALRSTEEDMALRPVDTEDEVTDARHRLIIKETQGRTTMGMIEDLLPEAHMVPARMVLDNNHPARHLLRATEIPQ